MKILIVLTSHESLVVHAPPISKGGVLNLIQIY